MNSLVLDSFLKSFFDTRLTSLTFYLTPPKLFAIIEKNLIHVGFAETEENLEYTEKETRLSPGQETDRLWSFANQLKMIEGVIAVWVNLYGSLVDDNILTFSHISPPT